MLQIKNKTEWYKLGLSSCWNKAEYYSRNAFKQLICSEILLDKFMIRNTKDSSFPGAQGSAIKVMNFLDVDECASIPDEVFKRLSIEEKKQND